MPDIYIPNVFIVLYSIVAFGWAVMIVVFRRLNK